MGSNHENQPCRPLVSSSRLRIASRCGGGVPEVLLHLGTVVGLMKVNTEYDVFEKQLDQIAHVYPESPGLFDDPKDWDKSRF